MDIESAGFVKFRNEVKSYCKEHFEMSLDNSGQLDELRKLIEEKNNEKISLSTLKRIFQNGQTKSVNDSTLDILARFIGDKGVYDSISKIKR